MACVTEESENADWREARISEINEQLKNAIIFESDDLHKSISMQLETYQKGLYLFFDENGKLMYIGQSGNLRGRLKSHLTGSGGTSSMYKDLIKTIKVVLLDSNKNLFSEERIFIENLKPAFNCTSGTTHFSYHSLYEKLRSIKYDDIEKDEKVKKLMESWESFPLLSRSSETGGLTKMKDSNQVIIANEPNSFIKAIRESIKLVVKSGEANSIDEIIDGLLVGLINK